MAQKTIQAVEVLEKRINLFPEQDYLNIVVVCKIKKDGRMIKTSVTMKICLEDFDFEDMSETAHDVVLALFTGGEDVMWNEMIRFANS